MASIFPRLSRMPISWGFSFIPKNRGKAGPGFWRIFWRLFAKQTSHPELRNRKYRARQFQLFNVPNPSAMKIIPAIDLLDGQVVRLFKGDYQQKKVYEKNPLRQAAVFAEAGFDHLHIVDLDGAKSGKFENLPHI